MAVGEGGYVTSLNLTIPCLSLPHFLSLSNFMCLSYRERRTAAVNPTVVKQQIDVRWGTRRQQEALSLRCAQRFGVANGSWR